VEGRKARKRKGEGKEEQSLELIDASATVDVLQHIFHMSPMVIVTTWLTLCVAASLSL